MKILKQGVCLALLGAGLVRSPARVWPRPRRPSRRRSPAASLLVPGPQHRGRGPGVRHHRPGHRCVRSRYLRSKRRPAAGRLGELRKAAAAAKADAYRRQYAGAFGAGRPTSSPAAVGRPPDRLRLHRRPTPSPTRASPSSARELKASRQRGPVRSPRSTASPPLTSTCPRGPGSPQAEAADRAVAMVKPSPARPATAAPTTDPTGLKAASATAVRSTGRVPSEASSGRNHPGLRRRGPSTTSATCASMVVVDANTGKVVNRWSMIDNALDRELYETNYNPASPAPT